MKIGNDFSDQLMMTEDKTGQDGVNDSDEDGKTYNIQDDQDQETGLDSGNGASNNGADQTFFGVHNGQGSVDGAPSSVVASDTFPIATSNGTDDNSSGSTLTSQISPDRQAEIQRLKNEMASQKEDVKEEEESATNYREMHQEL